MSNKHVDQESSTEDKMAVTTRGKLRKYLISNEIPVTDITPISGGSSNFVWRITNPSGQSSIIKLAEPFLVGNSAIPFPLDRQDFEARALTKIPKLISNDETIRIPALLHFDTENHILRLEDVGSKTLKDRYEDPKLDIQKIGESIGRWLARLHTSTTSEEVKRPFDHSVAKSMYRWNYNNLSSVLGKYGFDPTLGERINAKYGALLQTDDVCICHGDMWPGNVLFPESDAEEENLKFAIIDWEVARLGNGVTDLGHFAGEAWFLDRLRGGRGFLGAFLGAYVGERNLETEERERVAAQFGTHVTFWPTIYKWIAEEDKKGCIEYGNSILERVDKKDWEWFKNGDLGVLFKDES